MNNRIEKYMRKLRNRKNAVLFSMLIGSLIGVAITLLYAPQSGAQTRAQIHLRSMQLRNQAQMERVSAALTARNIIARSCLKPTALALLSACSRTAGLGAKIHSLLKGVHN